MGNPNKTTRTVMRWAHLLVGFLIGVFVYTPARDSETFVLLMQAAVVPTVTLTGMQAALDGSLAAWLKHLETASTRNP